MPRGRALLLAGLAALVPLGPALAQPSRDALPSRLASQSLLVAVARAGSRLVAVGDWGHVVLSDDGGRSWQQARDVPTRNTLTDVTFVDARRGWAVGHDAIVLHTSDGGETWERQFQAPDAEAPLLSVWFENARHGIAVGGFALVVETRDGGRTWERRQLEADPAPSAREAVEAHEAEVVDEEAQEDPHLNAVFPGSDGTLFIAAEAGNVFRSRDGGAHWQRLHPPYDGSFWGGLAPGDGSILVFGMRGHAFRSSDDGDTWSPVDTGTDQSLQSAVRLSDGRIALVGLGGTILVGDGSHFRVATEPDRKGIAAVAEGDGGDLVLLGEVGVKLWPTATAAP